MQEGSTYSQMTLTSKDVVWSTAQRGYFQKKKWRASIAFTVLIWTYGLSFPRV